MPHIFEPSSNALARASLVGVAGGLALTIWLMYALFSSAYGTRQGIPREQPVQFSHVHHVRDVGLDCRYCHTTVETQAFAGIPPTKTCMNCHSQIWATSPEVAPIQQSFQTDEPIRWVRVHDLPNFVFFNHSIHVAKGIGCVTCHGRIDQMPLMSQENTLQMQWCIDCHRAPEQHLRPREALFRGDWEPEPGTDRAALGRRLAKEYGIRSPQQLMACSTCHR